MRKWGLRILKLAYIGLIASLPVYAMANYAVTVGAGTNFGSVVIGGVHFASQLLCDMTVANQCAAVSAGGAVSTTVSTALPAGTNVIGHVIADTGSTTAVTGTVAATQSGTWTVQPGNTANTTAWKVDGSAATQPVSSTTLGVGTWAAGTLGAMANYGTSPGAVLVPGVNAFITNANANGQAVAASSSPVVLASNQSVADPCMFQAKTNLPISQNGTSSVQLVALSGATSIYVCSLSLVAAGATTVALTTGTGTACVTGNAAVLGSTTANIANSLSLAANGGLTLGNGTGTVAKGAASSELCMINGSNVFVSGNLTYVQQ